MDTASLLLELYGRIPPLAARAVDGLNAEELCRAPGAGANTIGWLVWHLARVQDHHVSELLGTEQVWVGGDWAGRFGLDARSLQHGLRPQRRGGRRRPAREPEVLLGLPARGRRAAPRPCSKDSAPDDLDRVVDQRWDPPVTLGVRLVSIADDSLQHVGQAAYARGPSGTEPASRLRPRAAWASGRTPRSGTPSRSRAEVDGAPSAMPAASTTTRPWSKARFVAVR